MRERESERDLLQLACLIFRTQFRSTPSSSLLSRIFFPLPLFWKDIDESLVIACPIVVPSIPFIHFLVDTQCDQSGIVLDFLVTNFLTKYFGKFLGYLKKCNFHLKMIWLLFGLYWKKLGNCLFHHLVTLLTHQNMLLALADDFFFLKNSFLNGLLLKSRE